MTTLHRQLAGAGDRTIDMSHTRWGSGSCKLKHSPEKVDMPVLSMVNQSCNEPALPADVVLKTRLPPYLPAPAVSYITDWRQSCFSREVSARLLRAGTGAGVKGGRAGRGGGGQVGSKGGKRGEPAGAGVVKGGRVGKQRACM